VIIIYLIVEVIVDVYIISGVVLIILVGGEIGGFI